MSASSSSSLSEKPNPEEKKQSDLELLKVTMKENDMKTLDSILDSLDGYECAETYFKTRKKKPQPPSVPPLVFPPKSPTDQQSAGPAAAPPPPRTPPPPPPCVAALFAPNEPLKKHQDKKEEEKEEEKGLQRTNSSSDFSLRCLSSLSSRFSFFFNPASSLPSKSSPSLPLKTPPPSQVKRAKSVPLFATHPTAKPATRESVAHSVWLLAQSARHRYEVTIALRDMSAQLMAISDAIGAVPDTAFEEALLAKQLSALATRCALFDTRMAADIWLIVADYDEFVLNCPTDAANALERAIYYIDSTDVRRIVGLLQQSGKLYEKGRQFDQALRVERKLEPYDLSVDWINNSRTRQSELAGKLQK